MQFITTAKQIVEDRAWPTKKTATPTTKNTVHQIDLNSTRAESGEEKNGFENYPKKKEKKLSFSSL